MAKKYSWQTDDESTSESQKAWSWQGGTLQNTIANNITSRVNTWLQNHNNYLSNYENRYKGRKYTYDDPYVKDSASWLETVSKQKSNFDAEADSILAYMDQYKGYLDDDLVKSVQSTLTSARGQQAAILDNTAKDNEWWSNFKDESEYQTAVRYDGYNKKYSGQKYDDIQKALSILDDGEEKEWLNYYKYDLFQEDGNYASKALSGLKSYEAQKVAEREAEKNKPWYEKVIESNPFGADTSLPTAMLTQQATNYRNDTSYREPTDKWSEGEKRQFGYLYAEDPNKAYDYAVQLNNDYAAYEKYLQQQDIGAKASANGGSMALYTLGEIATAPTAIGDFLDNVAEFAGRGTITQKSHFTPYEYFQAAQSGISNKLNAVDENGDAQKVLKDSVPILGGKGWGDIYSLGVSTANSMLSALTLGGVGTLVNFIGQGGAAGVDDALSRGATAEQALLYGTIVGSLEGLTEQIPANHLIKIGSSATLKNLLKQTAKQGLEEMVEEGASSFFGNLADDWIMKDKSNFNIMVQELMDDDPELTKEQAEKIALNRMANDIAFDAVGGFASGAANAFVVGGAKTAWNSQNWLKANKNAVKQYGEYTGDLIKEGLQSDPNSESYELAKKYQQQVEGTDKKAGKAMTGFQIRNLVAANEAQFAVEDFNEARNQAKDRLKELGENNTQIWPIAELVAKKATGQELTRKEISTLARSEFGAQVAKEMTTPAEETESSSSGYNITYKSITERVGEESHYGVSESGETTLRTNEDGESESIKIKEVTKINDGELYVKLEDGREVYAGDIDFANDSESFLYSAVADMENITPAAATALVKNFDATSEQTTQEYANGIDEAYTYGYHGYSVADMKAGDYAPKLTSQQMMSAYELGKQARKFSNEVLDAPKVQMRTAMQAKISQKQANQQLKKAFASDDVEVYFQDGSNVVKFDEHSHKYDDKRMAGVNAAKFLSKMGIGGKYYFYESYEKGGKRYYKDANGNEVLAPNGIFKAADGSIHIDLNAGNNGEGTTLFTMGHELTHFVKANSAKQFQTLADLVKETFDKTDTSLHQRVLAKQSQLSEIRGEKVSYDEAFEEVIADAMSTMLTDGNLYKKLAELKTKDKGLFNTIKKFFNDLIAKFKELYASLTPDQRDAQDIREMKDMFDRIQDAFAKALVEASDNFRASETALEQAGISVDANTDAGSIYSVRDVLTETDRNKVAKALAERFDVTVKEAKEWLKAETSLASLILNPKYSMYLDYEGDPNEVAIKQNSDYPQGTVDFSNICKKRREFTQVMNRILRNFPNHVFAATDLAKIRTIMGEEGMTLPCGICYVEDRRQLDTIVAQDFINGLKLYREGSKTRPDGKPFNANQLKGLQLTDGDTYVPTIYELVSLEGRNSLKAKNPNMEAAWVRYNNARGMQAVRLLTNEAEYKRQILKYNKKTVQSKNDHGGLRIYSFSDAEMFHLIDIIQVITDSATVGLSLQGYTKVNEYAKAVKDTGEKLNRSLIPKGDLGYHMENGKVVLDYDTVEGIDINHKDFFDNKDNPNVGNITIGINDVQIRASMLSDFVDQIIPFHTGQSEEVLGEKGIAAWDNYKDFQTEKDLATGKTSSHQVNIYTEVFQAAEAEGKPIQNKRQFVEKFLQVCKENGLQPRFAQFLNTDANGDYIYTEGYHKFLVDFKTFAQTDVGEYLPQMPVKPIFDDAYITGLLENYVTEQKAKDAEVAKQMPKVIERITNEIVKPTKDAYMYSERKTFKNGQNANGVFVANVLIDLGNSHSEWWTGRYNHDIFSMSKSDDTEFRQFYQELLKRTKNMEEYSEEKQVVEDSFIVRDGKGKEFIYRVSLDGYLHGVVLEKIDKAKYVAALQRMTKGGANGKSVANIKGRTRNARSGMGRNRAGNGGNRTPNGHPGYGGLGSGSSEGNSAGNDHAGESADQKVSAVTDFLADGKLKGNYTVSEISEMFDAWNSDPELTELSKKVFAKLQEIMNGQEAAYWATPYPIRFKSETYLQKEYYNAPHGVFEPSRTDGNYGITYNLDYFRKASDQDKARILLHEAIHACTVAAIKSTERRIPKNADPMEFTPDESWSDAQKASLELIQTFSQVRVANERNEYGQKNVYEMVAEMSNPEFRAMLKKERLWGRIVDAIKRIFGIEQRTAFDAVSNALEKILELENDDIRYSERTNAPTFYSQMGKVVEGMKQDKFGASSVISMLRGRGVKAEEIRWSGIQAFLDGKKSVTKAELMEFIQGSMLHIEEESRGGAAFNEFMDEWRAIMDYDADAENLVLDDNFLADTDMYLQYSVDDGNLEQEAKDHLMDLARKAKDEGGGTRPSNWDAYKLDGGENYRELVFKMPGSTYTNQAMEAHWGRSEKGVLAHARMQDFEVDGKKMLFVEEIQSDWHNAGQKQGYFIEGDKLTKDNTELRHENGWYNLYHDGKDLHQGVSEYFLKQRFTNGITDDEIHEGLVDEYNRSVEHSGNGWKAPDAPFKSNYHEYVLKRLIRMAADEGYDSIGWTTADIQSKRWSDEYAEGYRIEYDQDIPKFLKKYGKQWGAEVGKTTLNSGNNEVHSLQVEHLRMDIASWRRDLAQAESDSERAFLQHQIDYLKKELDSIIMSGSEVWSMDITPAMKKSVLEEGQAMYSERLPDSVSNRSLLANAFEGITMNSIEYSMIQEYKSHIKELNTLESQLYDLNQEIRKIRFGTEGARDTARLTQLEDKAKRIAKEINRHDKRLLNLETAEPLRKVIERERKKEAQKTREHVKEIQQNKKVRAEQAELRHKIRKAVRDLDKILNRGNKKQNVKEDMQNVVTKALKAADILFTDNYGNYDMLRNGIGTDLSDAEEALVNTCTRMLKDIDKMPSDGYESFQARQEAENRLRTKMSKLNEVFARERKRLNNTTVSSILGELAEAYASLEKSEQSYVQGAYTEAVHNFLKNLQNEVGGTIVQDMTKNQLEHVYAAYQMVLNTVRNANKMFNESLKQSREQLGNAVISEVMAAGGTHGLWTKGEIATTQASWNNTKPIWVANRIGSETFGKLMDGLFKGQYNFAVDVDEAKRFKLKMDDKYHPRNWDAEKLYSFESSTGRKFNLNLQQIMSLYAFSKREQAYSHILNGGFVFEANSTVLVDKKGIKRTYLHDGATSYKLNEVTLNEIVNSLTAEQKAYVDEMQKYLSEVMGAKGNEVSMKLYGIRMFKEQNYFPLRSSGAYMEKAKEAEMKKQQGQINLVNSGFTHAVKSEAKNPIILSGFMDVWAEHCNEMSMYHSMVLPMEDFRKVYNYSTVHDEKMDSASVYQTIQDAYGASATSYIDQLYRELNAGATVDPRETSFKARISKFKKAAVMLSGSVVVQQFSSIGRAYAVIDPKYFVGTKVNSGTQMKTVDEMKKYAPVAIIKEMGGFDTGTKGSAKNYIMAEEYGKGERIKGLVKDEQYRGDIMGYLPAKADELTWCNIWEAAKRETHAKHNSMDVKSEEFLKLAGDRFAEIIEKTQVYDSVLARSANMRSKGGLMSMATAFMAEPTTTINLLEDAIRGRSVKNIARAFGAVAVSIVLNNALASIVYAMRDDDDDETFIEKYFQSFTSGMIDDINPMTYYPFLKDVYSLFQGYDVERADMSVIADVRDALKKAMSVIGKDTSEMDEDELVDHYKQINSVLMSVLDAGCSWLGVPLKNVRRDAKGVINAYQTINKDLTERDTSWSTFWDKVGSAAKDTIPIYAWTKDKAKPDKLYDAIMGGDKTYLARIKSTYKTEEAYHSAVRTALKDNDERIHEAALAQINGDPSKRVSIAKQIIADGFDLDDVITAINSEISKLSGSGEESAKKVKGYYKVEDFVREYANGDAAVLEDIREDIISTAVKNGKTVEKADADFTSNVKSETKDAYFTGGLSDSVAVNLLIEYVDMDEEEAAELVDYWDFCKEYPEYELSMANVDKYHEFAEPANIPLDVFTQYVNNTKDLATKYDKWGDVEVSKREQVLDAIDALPLTWKQKDALYLAHGYAESEIWDVPW